MDCQGIQIIHFLNWMCNSMSTHEFQPIFIQYINAHIIQIKTYIVINNQAWYVKIFIWQYFNSLLLANLHSSDSNLTFCWQRTTFQWFALLSCWKLKFWHLLFCQYDHNYAMMLYIFQRSYIQNIFNNDTICIREVVCIIPANHNYAPHFIHSILIYDLSNDRCHCDALNCHLNIR